MAGIICKRCQASDYVKEERGCAGVAALSLQPLRLQFHGNQTAWQASSDEGVDDPTLRHGQHELSYDCPPVRSVACQHL